jgi:hypothetical protein
MVLADEVRLQLSEAVIWLAVHARKVAHDGIDLDTCGTMALVELIRQRRDLFPDSAKAFGPTPAAQGYVIPTTESPHDVLALIEIGAGYTRPLAVQIEALLWLASAASDAGKSSIDVMRAQARYRLHPEDRFSRIDIGRCRCSASTTTVVTIRSSHASRTRSSISPSRLWNRRVSPSCNSSVKPSKSPK